MANYLELFVARLELPWRPLCLLRLLLLLLLLLGRVRPRLGSRGLHPDVGRSRLGRCGGRGPVNDNNVPILLGKIELINDKAYHLFI